MDELLPEIMVCTAWLVGEMPPSPLLRGFCHDDQFFDPYRGCNGVCVELFNADRIIAQDGKHVKAQFVGKASVCLLHR